MISSNSAGTDGGAGYSENPSISDNGQVIDFDSTAPDLTSNEANVGGCIQVFVSNPGTLAPASGNSAGAASYFLYANFSRARQSGQMPCVNRASECEVT
jgi:hypothetical protein